MIAILPTHRPLRIFILVITRALPHSSMLMIHQNLLPITTRHGWIQLKVEHTPIVYSTVNGIGSTYSIEEMYDHTSGIYHCVHALIPVYGEHTNNTSSGSWQLLYGWNQ